MLRYGRDHKLDKMGKTTRSILFILIIAIMLSGITLVALGQATTPTPEADKTRKQQADDVFNIAFAMATTESVVVKRIALERADEARQIYHQIGDLKDEAQCLALAGRVSGELGDKQKALEYYNLSLPLLAKAGDVSLEASTLSNIGTIYYDLGEKTKALEFFDRALLKHRQAKDLRGQAISLINLGSLYVGLGQVDKAFDIFDEAVPLIVRLGDPSLKAWMLNVIGNLYDSNGDYKQALDSYAGSLRLRQQLGDITGEATTLNNMAVAYARSGDGKKAAEFLSRALPLFRQTGDLESEAATLGNLMSVWDSLHNARMAVFYGKASINQYQTLRQKISELDKDMQKAYLRKIENTYRQLADILISQGRSGEALQVLDSFKDQQFFDLDRSVKKAPEPLSFTKRESEISDEYELKNHSVADLLGLIQINRKIRDPGSADGKDANDQLEAALTKDKDDLATFLEQTADGLSKKAVDKDDTVEIADLKKLQNTLTQLEQQTGQKTAAIYQLAGEKSFSALVVTPKSIEKVSTAIDGDKLNDKAKQLWALLQSDKYDTTVLSQEIYDVVFKPVEAVLPKDTRTIMWSLDGNLRYIPMAGLYDGKHFLAERYNNVVFTRSDPERLTRAVTPKWTGTGFGSSMAARPKVFGEVIPFPALPGVKEELAAVFKDGGGVLDGKVYPDRDFTRTRFIEALKQHRPVVHIASHFSFRPGDEARSFLLLGDGTAYTLDEMKRETDLFKGVELLTLSACNTAAQQADATGREIDGFAELAQRLGAGAVLATLWPVSDASTPWLMRDLYTNRESKAGATKADALTNAQIALLNGTARTLPLPAGEKGPGPVVRIVITKDGRRSGTARSDEVYIAEADAPLFKRDDKRPFAHPFYWAPFVLIGNWR